MEEKKESIDEILSDLNTLLNKMPAILADIKLPEIKPADIVAPKIDIAEISEPVKPADPVPVFILPVVKTKDEALASDKVIIQDELNKIAPSSIETTVRATTRPDSVELVAMGEKEAAPKSEPGPGVTQRIKIDPPKAVISPGIYENTGGFGVPDIDELFRLSGDTAQAAGPEPVVMEQITAKPAAEIVPDSTQSETKPIVEAAASDGEFERSAAEALSQLAEDATIKIEPDGILSDGTEGVKINVPLVPEKEPQSEIITNAEAVYVQTDLQSPALTGADIIIPAAPAPETELPDKVEIPQPPPPVAAIEAEKPGMDCVGVDLSAEEAKILEDATVMHEQDDKPVQKAESEIVLEPAPAISGSPLQQSDTASEFTLKVTDLPDAQSVPASPVIEQQPQVAQAPMDATMVIQPEASVLDAEKTVIYQSEPSQPATDASPAIYESLETLAAKSVPEGIDAGRIRQVGFLYAIGEENLCAELIVKLDAICGRSPSKPMFITRAFVEMCDPNSPATLLLRKTTEAKALALICVGKVPQESLYEIENAFVGDGPLFRHFQRESLNHSAILDLVAELMLK